MITWTFRRAVALVGVVALVLGGCGDDGSATTATPVATPASAATPATQAAPVSTAPPDSGAPVTAAAPPPSAAVATTVEAGLPPLPAAPQRVDFAAPDGQNLVGYYWSASRNPAPIVVLMHWAGGDQRDWSAIAPWLQNRRDELTGSERAIGADCGDQLPGPWLDPSWFPPMPLEVSFGVFTFDFRDFCESESGLEDPSQWALDAQAALDAVVGLDGVEPSLIAVAGASIGADGAADGALLHNRSASTSIGVLSWSPGDYLMGEHYDMTYAATVTEHDETRPPVTVWCFAAEDDTESAAACRSASGDTYLMHLVLGDAHGMRLIAPDFEPNALEYMQDWLEVVFGFDIG